MRREQHDNFFGEANISIFLTPAIYTYAILRAGKPDLHGPKLIFTVTLGVVLLYMYIYLLVY